MRYPTGALVDDVYAKESLIEDFVFPVIHNNRGSRVRELPRVPGGGWTEVDNLASVRKSPDHLSEDIEWFRARANASENPKDKKRLNSCADLLEDCALIYHLHGRSFDEDSPDRKALKDIQGGVDIMQSAYEGRIADLHEAINFLLDHTELDLRRTGLDTVGSSFSAIISKSPRSARKTLLEVLNTYYSDYFQDGDLVAMKILSSEMTTREDNSRCMKW